MALLDFNAFERFPSATFPTSTSKTWEYHVLVLALLSPNPLTLLQSGDRIPVLHSVHYIIFSCFLF